MAAAGNAQTFPRQHGQDAWLGKPFYFVWRHYDTASRPRGKRCAGNFVDEYREYGAWQAVDGRLAFLRAWQYERKPAHFCSIEFTDVTRHRLTADFAKIMEQRIFVKRICRGRIPFSRGAGALPWRSKGHES